MYILYIKYIYIIYLFIYMFIYLFTYLFNYIVLVFFSKKS